VGGWETPYGGELMVGERHPSDLSATSLLNQFRATQWEAQRTFDVAVAQCAVVDGRVTLAGGVPGGAPMAAWIVAARDLCIRPGCQHADGNMPLFGLLSRRGVVYCAQCLIPAQMDDRAARPNECDSCGKEIEIFAESTSKISTAITVVGHLCGDCQLPGAFPSSHPHPATTIP
jgi:hypothetical protein